MEVQLSHGLVALSFTDLSHTAAAHFQCSSGESKFIDFVEPPKYRRHHPNAVPLPSIFSSLPSSASTTRQHHWLEQRLTAFLRTASAFPVIPSSSLLKCSLFEETCFSHSDDAEAAAETAIWTPPMLFPSYFTALGTVVWGKFHRGWALEWDCVGRNQLNRFQDCHCCCCSMLV